MRKVIAIALASLLLVSVVPAPAVAHEGFDSEGVTHQTGIFVTPEGDATIRIVHQYDMSDEQQSQTYENITKSQLQEKANTVSSDMASFIAEQTGRDVKVTNTRAFKEVDGADIGNVVFEFTLTNVAEQRDDGKLVLTEPVKSGYYDDFGAVVVITPNSQIESATPEPTIQQEGLHVWENLQQEQYSEFEVIIGEHDHDSHEHSTPTEDNSDTTTETPTDDTNNADGETNTTNDTNNSNNDDDQGALGGLSTTALGGIAVVLVVAIGAGAFLLGRNSGGE